MSSLQTTTLIAAAIGATVGVISAAGIFLYQRFLEERQYKMRNNNLEVVNQRISELQAELQALRQQQNQQKRKKRTALRKITSNDSTYATNENDTDIDTYSTAGTDIGEDEFFDCSDSEGATGETELRASEAVINLEAELLKIDEQQEPEEEIDINIYYKLQNLVKLYPDNVDVIWRFARACYNRLAYISDVKEKKSIITEGLKACTGIISMKNADLHKWYAILLGLHGEYLPVAEKIKNGSRFKEHLMIALELRSKDSGLHHLLGRFKYEVSRLSWLEKKIAATFFSEPPSASYEEAIDCFKQAEEYAVKPYLENRLFLSKAYIETKQYEKAIYWLNKIFEEPATTKEDQNVQSEARKLHNTYYKYI